MVVVALEVFVAMRAVAVEELARSGVTATADRGVLLAGALSAFLGRETAVAGVVPRTSVGARPLRRRTASGRGGWVAKGRLLIPRGCSHFVVALAALAVEMRGLCHVDLMTWRFGNLDARCRGGTCGTSGFRSGGLRRFCEGAGGGLQDAHGIVGSVRKNEQ